MKKILKKVGVAIILGVIFIAGSMVFAAATIPAACTTPGTCTDISSTFQAVVSKTSMKFLDSDASNFVELKSPATVASDVTLTLPTTAGANGEILSTDGAGVLSWTSAGGGTVDSLTDTDVTGVATGATMYFDGTNWVDLPAGTAGQTLAMNAGATAPEWVSGATSTPLNYQEITPPSVSAIQTTGLKPVTGSDFTLPSGTHEVKVEGRVDIVGYYDMNGYVDVRLIDVTNGGVTVSSKSVRLKDDADTGGANPSAYLPFSFTKRISLLSSNDYKLELQVYDRGAGNSASTLALNDIKILTKELPTASIIEAGSTAVNDQGASGYMDIGTMRIQWGDQTMNSGATITYPQPFGAVPSLTMESHGFTGVTTNYTSGTATSFVTNIRDNSGNTTSAPVSWIAIGLKP